MSKSAREKLAKKFKVNNEKFPGGVKIQAKYLRKEGFTILPVKGKKPPKVKDFEKYLL